MCWVVFYDILCESNGIHVYISVGAVFDHGNIHTLRIRLYDNFKTVFSLIYVYIVAYDVCLLAVYFHGNG